MTGHFEKGRWIEEQTEESKCIGTYHAKLEIDRTELDTLLDDMKEFEKLLFLKWASKQKHPLEPFMRYGKWIIATFVAFVIAYMIYVIE
jgi:hypothetical protein